MFRAASTRDKHSRSACPTKLTCACGAEFSSKQKHASHVKDCNVQQVAGSTSTSPRPTSVPSIDGALPLATPSPTKASASSAAHPPPSGSAQPCASGDMSPTGGLRQEENQYLVTFDNELSTFNQPASPKLFDLNKYLQGDIDLASLLDMGD